MSEQGDDSDSDEEINKGSISHHRQSLPRRTSSRVHHSDHPIQRKESSRSRSSRRYDELDPLEKKKRQLDNLRDQNNLRKFVISNDQSRDRHSLRRKASDHRSNDSKDKIIPDKENQNNKTKKGLFSLFRGRSLSRPKENEVENNDDSIRKDDDARRHFEDHASNNYKRTSKRLQSPPPPTTPHYEEGEIKLYNAPQSRHRSRSNSRPKVKSEKDYQLPSKGEIEQSTRRSRSTSRARSSTGEEQNRQLSKMNRVRSNSKSREESDVVTDKLRRDKGMSRPRTKSELDDGWTPSKSTSGSRNHLPPPAPKRSPSTNRKKEYSESQHERSNDNNLPPHKSPQRDRSTARAEIQNKSLSKSSYPRRSLSRSRREGDSRAEESRDDSGASRQYSMQSRTRSKSSNRSGGYQRSKGSSGTKELIRARGHREEISDRYFVE